MVAEILLQLAETPPGSLVVPWWLRFGVILYGALLVAAFMIFAQTKHQSPRGAIWALIIAFVPILGALVYITVQIIGHRRKNPRHVKGRAETMAPEEYDDDAPR